MFQFLLNMKPPSLSSAWRQRPELSSSTFWVMLSLEPRALYVLGKPCTAVYTLRHFLFLYIICVCVMSKNYLTSRPFIYLKKCLFVYACIRSQRFRQCLTEPGAHQWGSFAGEWAPGLILVQTSPPPPRNPTLRFDVSAADPDSVFLLVWRVLDWPSHIPSH